MPAMLTFHGWRRHSRSRALGRWVTGVVLTVTLSAMAAQAAERVLDLGVEGRVGEAEVASLEALGGEILPIEGEAAEKLVRVRLPEAKLAAASKLPWVTSVRLLPAEGPSRSLAGMLIYKDPVTGRYLPWPEGVSLPRVKAPDRAPSYVTDAPLRRQDGTERAGLDGRLRYYAVARVAEDGTRETYCLHGDVLAEPGEREEGATAHTHGSEGEE